MQPADLSDDQLDATLARLYREHKLAGLTRRMILHRAIADVLAEQKARRDAWLVRREVLTQASNATTLIG